METSYAPSGAVDKALWEHRAGNNYWDQKELKEAPQRRKYQSWALTDCKEDVLGAKAKRGMKWCGVVYKH